MRMLQTYTRSCPVIFGSPTGTTILNGGTPSFAHRREESFYQNDGGVISTRSWEYIVLMEKPITP